MFSAYIVGLAVQAAAPVMPAFLAGCWRSGSGQDWTEECWMAPRGGLMLGASREGSGERFRNWEWANIVRGADNQLIFHASPKGRTPTPFKAERLTATEVVFVNRANDYPQRITYTIKGDTLVGRISKLDGSDPMEWTYRRDPSAAAAPPTTSSPVKR